jgi:hypothetical protein
MSASQLLETLKSFGQDMNALRGVLGAPPERLFVYYICPLTNLKQVIGVGILPNATAPQKRADLSGQSVQAKRDVEVLFADGREIGVHQCINLFWNPINWTMRAFQRNGLLSEASSKNPDDAVVCVLEIDLESLLSRDDCYWTVAPQNFAGSGFASFSPDYYTGTVLWEDGTPRCDWRTIFATSENDDRLVNRKRSAELIVHLGNSADGKSSVPLPFDLVERIIVPADSIRALNPDQQSFLKSVGKPISALSTANGTVIYFPRSELLRAETKFIDSLRNRHKWADSDVLSKLNAAFKAIKDIESKHPRLSPTRNRFLKSELADGHHGSLHAARVMFWSAFILQHYPEGQKNELLPAVLVAASLHDTCRKDGEDDETHGDLAVKAHKDEIAKFLADAQRLQQCLNAIKFHCIPDDRCPNELALQILKDADALDRGRFGAPNCEGGCNTKLFRTELLKSQDNYKNIAWMAYWAAVITRYSSFGETPCSDFSNALCNAIKSL